MEGQRRINIGDEVFGSDGRKIGTVRTVSPDFVRVTAGRFTFGKEYRIPCAAIQSTEPGRVDLCIGAREIESPSRARSARPAPSASGVAEPPALSIPLRNICGHQLRDATGKAIGKIIIVGPDYAKVPTGPFGLGDVLYVPLSQIIHCDNDSCYVQMTKEQVAVQGWGRRPG